MWRFVVESCEMPGIPRQTPEMKKKLSRKTAVPNEKLKQPTTGNGRRRPSWRKIWSANVPAGLSHPGIISQHLSGGLSTGDNTGLKTGGQQSVFRRPMP
jgi:hypothetical protein